MMGVTQLLEELLAEKEAKEAALQVARAGKEEARTVSPQEALVIADMQAANRAISSASNSPAIRSPVSHPFHRKSPGGDDLLDAGDGRMALHPALLTPMEDRTEEPCASPLSRQIAELAREMDDCVSSLSNWDDERLKHKEAVIAELEAQYGRSYGEILAASADLALTEGDELQMGALARLGGNEEGLREMRIAGLRAEVEELRRRAASAESGSAPSARALAAYARGSTPYPGLVLDGSSIGGLVDSASGRSMEDTDGGFPGLDLDDTLEGRLASAQERVRLYEDAMEVAQWQTEDQLGELDMLLSECEELHGLIPSRGDDGGRPRPYDP
mmetsp:Transcript_39018/g.71042  ORF Transcript_39018/g.71042 Transcript_39018/m.71042 type:complete len:330 (-) Transcript_39018:103-1092(-)